jgi:hypothetical protein
VYRSQSFPAPQVTTALRPVDSPRLTDNAPHPPLRRRLRTLQPLRPVHPAPRPQRHLPFRWPPASSPATISIPAISTRSTSSSILIPRIPTEPQPNSYSLAPMQPSSSSSASALLGPQSRSCCNSCPTFFETPPTTPSRAAVIASSAAPQPVLFPPRKTAIASSISSSQPPDFDFVSSLDPHREGHEESCQCRLRVLTKRRLLTRW